MGRRLDRIADVNDTAATTILAIDDTLEARILLRRAVERVRSDVKMLVVDTGLEGVEAARFYHPNVIVLDLGLPDMDGRDVLKALRADPVTTRIPVVVVTGDARQQTETEVRTLGATDYLTKPYHIGQLAERVLAACT